MAKLFLLKAWKPALLLGAAAYSSYGFYQWDQARKAFHIDNNFTNDQLYKLFDSIDKDKSGSIDRDELLKALEKSGVKMANMKVDAMMEVGDENHDGSISKEEFAHIFKTIKSNSKTNEETKFSHIDIKVDSDALSHSNIKDITSIENEKLKKNVIKQINSK